MLIGSVRITRIGLMTAFTIPKIKATIKAVVKLSTLKPGTISEAMKMASAESSQFIRIFINDTYDSTQAEFCPNIKIKRIGK